MTQAIKDFIAAGEKFSSSECKIEMVAYDEDHTYNLKISNQVIINNCRYYPAPVGLAYAQFFAQAANARADIKAMYELMEEMAGALEFYADYDPDKPYGENYNDENAKDHYLLDEGKRAQQTLTKYNAMKG